MFATMNGTSRPTSRFDSLLQFTQKFMSERGDSEKGEAKAQTCDTACSQQFAHCPVIGMAEIGAFPKSERLGWWEPQSTPASHS